MLSFPMLGVSEMKPIPTITIQFECSAWALAQCFIQLLAARLILLCILMSLTSNVLLSPRLVFGIPNSACPVFDTFAQHNRRRHVNQLVMS